MICSKCGKTLPDSMNFCQYCGNKLKNDTPQVGDNSSGGDIGTRAESPKTVRPVFQLSYNVDLVLCIDATESMDNILDIVKNNAINLYSDVLNLMEKNKKHIDTLRVRVVAFRDYLADGGEAMLTTRFFTLPEEAEAFSECVHQIEAKGGGDDPEDGLEALGFAICSDWNCTGMKKRHVIALWSDAPTHPLGYGRQRSNYPQNMARDLKELTSWWGSAAGTSNMMDQYAKRLILFTPEVNDWMVIANHWDKVYRVPTMAGNGSAEHSYETILNAIIHTI